MTAAAPPVLFFNSCANFWVFHTVLHKCLFFAVIGIFHNFLRFLCVDVRCKVKRDTAVGCEMMMNIFIIRMLDPSTTTQAARC